MKGLFAMSLPIILMNVFQQLFNAIDMTVLGKFASDNAVGAVGACGTHISLFTGLVGGLATGANVVISRFLGHGDRDKAERAVGTSLIVGVIGGFALSVAGFVYQTVFRNPLASPDVIGVASGASAGAAAGILFFGGALAVTLTVFPVSP